MSAWKITGIMIFKNTPDQICSRCRPNWDEGLLRYICDGEKFINDLSYTGWKSSKV